MLPEYAKAVVESVVRRHKQLIESYNEHADEPAQRHETLEWALITLAGEKVALADEVRRLRSTLERLKACHACHYCNSIIQNALQGESD